MLERFEVFNYRSCIHTTIDLQDDLSVLIGPNGSGKTNVMNALLLLRSLTSDAYWRQDISPDTANECRLKAWFRYSEKKVIFTANILLHTDENNSDVIVRSKESWYVKDFTGNSKRIKLPLQGVTYLKKYESFYGREHLRPKRAQRDISFRRFGYFPPTVRPAIFAIWEFLHDIKYYSASQFTNPSLCSVSFEVEQEGPRRRGVRLQRHSRFLYDLYEAQNTTTYDQFFDVVGPRGIGLVDKIDFKEITTSSIDYKVRSGGEIHPRKQQKKLVVPQFTIGSNKLSPSQLSEGTFRTITLLFYLITEERSALLLEEPEVCVHHGLLSSIMELIRIYSERKQIIISTHSDFVLDKLKPRHVYQVSRKSMRLGTTVSHITKSLSSNELKALKKFLDTEGNLGEYWRHGGLDYSG